MPTSFALPGSSRSNYTASRPIRQPSDWLTVASLAILAYAAANVLHEGVGYGGACLLVGGTPQLLTSVDFECGTDGLTPLAARLVAASGTVVNLIAGGLAVLAYRRAAARGPAVRYLLW